MILGEFTAAEIAAEIKRLEELHRLQMNGLRAFKRAAEAFEALANTTSKAASIAAMATGGEVVANDTEADTPPQATAKAGVVAPSFAVGNAVDDGVPYVEPLGCDPEGVPNF